MRLLLKKTDEINASVDIPGSKSYTNRALIAAVLSDGQSVIRHISMGDDSATMIRCLKQLGAKISQNEDTVIVEGWGSDLPSIEARLDVGPAGTTTRFLTALCSILPNSKVEIHGNDRMNERPISPLVEALRGLGITIEHLGKDGCTPLRITTGPPSPIKELFIDGSASSQYVTALMLVAPALSDGVRISVRGAKTSASYIDMTLSVLSTFGVRAAREDEDTVLIKDSYGDGIDYSVEADASGAVNFMSLAAVGRGSITIANLSANSQQGDMHYLQLLKNMGCKIENKNGLKISAERELGSIDADLNLLPDSAMALAVTAGFANGTSKITGLSTLKHKETDRLQALQNELAKLHINTAIDDHSIEVSQQTREPLKPPVISTYDDHRIAMAFAIACTQGDVIIDEAEVVSKSFPSFWDVLRQCGVEITELDG